MNERTAVKYHDRLVEALANAVEMLEEFDCNGVTQLMPAGRAELANAHALLAEVGREPWAFARSDAQQSAQAAVKESYDAARVCARDALDKP